MEPLLQWKAKCITYSENVFLALGVQHAMRMRHIIICGLIGCRIFFHITHNCKIFGKKKKKATEYEVF